MDWEGTKEENGLELRIPKKLSTFRCESKKISFVSIGEKNDLDTKNILLIGETGAGKTTMLNAIYNHFYGVEFKDNYRIRLFAEEEGCQGKDRFVSQTEYITSYLFYSQPFMKHKYNIRVIDTPGISDTRGAEIQKRVSYQIKEFLEKEDYGIVDLHCLGFVTRDYARIVESFEKVIKDSMENFGSNTEYITYVLRTHTTENSEDFMDLCKKVGLRSITQFSFDNGSLYKPNKAGGLSSTKTLKRSELDWDETAETFEKYFESLSRSFPVSLQLSREVVQIKMTLEHDKQNLFNSIMLILEELAASRDNQKMLRDFKTNMNTNKNWKGKEAVTTVDKIDVNEKASWWQWKCHSHNCENCQESCHYVCHALRFCPSSPCDACNCSDKAHVIAKYIYEKSVTYKEVTNEEIRKRFEDAESQHKQLEEIMCITKEQEEDMIKSIARMIHYMVLQTEQLEKISRVKKHLSAKDIINEIKHVTFSGNDVLCTKICEMSPNFLCSLDEAIRNTEIDKQAWIRHFEKEKKQLNSKLMQFMEYMAKAKVFTTK